jgi:hydroxymethylpyrimidine pyrophosphatase-like HAD family hydrolase
MLWSAPARSVATEPAHPAASAHRTEADFYQTYEWCLNPYLTVADAVRQLCRESDRLAADPMAAWQTEEIATNLFLLSCGLLNCWDEYLRGPALRLPRRLAETGAGRGAAHLVEAIATLRLRRRRLTREREQWLALVVQFLSLVLPGQPIDSLKVAAAARGLANFRYSALPRDLRNLRLGVPTPFSRLDLTPHDVLALGKRLAQRLPDRGQLLLLVGLRTSGSYFAPLLKAFFDSQGYREVRFLTITANKGLGRQERMRLERFAARGYSAVIVDDPPYTSGTLVSALAILTKVGFARQKLLFLAATHPAKRGWCKWLPPDSVITLEPEQWHKMLLLDPKAASTRLTEYFHNQGFSRICVDVGGGARAANADLEIIASDERGVRLKRVFEVRLHTHDGEELVKYVLAKSVGWGFYGYPAFLAGTRLDNHVPAILGLRDGILYMEWVPQQTAGLFDVPRSELISTFASYVAARARLLRLDAGAIVPQRYNNGIALLAKTLSRVYGPPLTNLLMRARLSEKLRQLRCPYPCLIDGNMASHEWILGSDGPLKTDFEHHGLGKAALNVTDPAYDLADTMLNLALSPEEERTLILQYIEESGDATVDSRLFIYKLLCALWTMNEVQEQLFSSPRSGEAQLNYHRRFMNAWNFLTRQTAYHCGALCPPRTELSWRGPLIVLDVDGVLDRRLFGYPSTTAAGIAAISQLHTHEFSIALNTARSASEVKDYCKAYSLAGGIAEHGSYLWDAVSGREQVLVSAESLRQLGELRERLRLIPGIFLDERHQYSIRAFTYREKPLGIIQTLLSSARASSIGDGALSHISTHVVNELLVNLKLDRLSFHHTPIDTAIVAKEVDKGTGLTCLRNWLLPEDTDMIAVGDGEADLAMFRVASRSFAPANIGCGRQARFLGCEIVPFSDQRGLLEIVRRIVHPKNHPCARCEDIRPHWAKDPFFPVLQAADGRGVAHFLRAMFDPTAYRFFVRS